MQQNANEKMVAYHAKKNKISGYNVGETVLVQNPKSKTKQGKRVLCESPVYAGKIIETAFNTKCSIAQMKVQQ